MFKNPIIVGLSIFAAIYAIITFLPTILFYIAPFIFKIALCVIVIVFAGALLLTILNTDVVRGYINSDDLVNDFCNNAERKFKGLLAKTLDSIGLGRYYKGRR